MKSLAILPESVHFVCHLCCHIVSDERESASQDLVSSSCMTDHYSRGARGRLCTCTLYYFLCYDIGEVHVNQVLKICSPSSLHDKRLFLEVQEAKGSIDRPSSPVQMATLGTNP